MFAQTIYARVSLRLLVQLGGSAVKTNNGKAEVRNREDRTGRGTDQSGSQKRVVSTSGTAGDKYLGTRGTHRDWGDTTYRRNGSGGILSQLIRNVVDQLAEAQDTVRLHQSRVERLQTQLDELLELQRLVERSNSPEDDDPPPE